MTVLKKGFVQINQYKMSGRGPDDKRTIVFPLYMNRLHNVILVSNVFVFDDGFMTSSFSFFGIRWFNIFDMHHYTVKIREKKSF